MQAWLEDFKLALIKEDLEKIELLSEKKLEDLSYAPQYLALLKEALALFASRQKQLKLEMNKLERAKKYVQ